MNANGDLYINQMQDFRRPKRFQNKIRSPKTIPLNPSRSEWRPRFLSGHHHDGHQRFRREEPPFALDVHAFLKNGRGTAHSFPTPLRPDVRRFFPMRNTKTDKPSINEMRHQENPCLQRSAIVNEILHTMASSKPV